MSINLLPPQIRSRRKAVRRNALAILVVTSVLIVVVLGVIALWSLKIILEGTVRDRQAQIDTTQAQIKRFQTLAEEVTDAKARATTLESLYNSRAQWTSILSGFTAAMPTAVVISSWSGNLDSAPAISVAATAPSIREAEKFKVNLEASPLFEKVTLSGFTVTPAGVTITLTANLQKAAPPAAGGTK